MTLNSVCSSWKQRSSLSRSGRLSRNRVFVKNSVSSTLALKFLLAVLLLFVLFPLQNIAMAQGANLTLAEYQQFLAQSLTELETIDNQKEEFDLEQLTIWQEKFTTIEEVTYPSGEVVTLQPLITEEMLPQSDEEIEEQRLKVENLSARIKLVHDQIDASASDNSEARLVLLQEVFNRPEFNPQPTLWERFRAWLQDLIERFWPQQDVDVNPLGEWVTRLVAWTVALIGAIAAVWLLSYWLRGLLGNFVADAELRRRREDGELVLTATETREQAVQSAQVGNYRQAVRQLYLSALLGLEERGAIRYDRTLTNREVLAQAHGQTELQEHLEPIVETFDDVWYGIHEPDQNTFTDYQREINALEQVEERQEELNDASIKSNV